MSIKKDKAVSVKGKRSKKCQPYNKEPEQVLHPGYDLLVVKAKFCWDAIVSIALYEKECSAIENTVFYLGAMACIVGSFIAGLETKAGLFNTSSILILAGMGFITYSFFGNLSHVSQNHQKINQASPSLTEGSVQNWSLVMSQS